MDNKAMIRLWKEDYHINGTPPLVDGDERDHPLSSGHEVRPLQWQLTQLNHLVKALGWDISKLQLYNS